MNKTPRKASEIHSADTLKELGRLHQESRSALDLAVVALAPTELARTPGSGGGPARILGRTTCGQSACVGAGPPNSHACDEKSRRLARLAQATPCAQDPIRLRPHGTRQG